MLLILVYKILFHMLKVFAYTKTSVNKEGSVDS